MKLVESLQTASRTTVHNIALDCGDKIKVEVADTGVVLSITKFRNEGAKGWRRQALSPFELKATIKLLGLK